MKKQIKQVEEFYKAFNIPKNNKPTLISMGRADLRWRLMEEENREYLEACAKGNIVEVADALGDKLYILLGTILEHGMQDIIVDVFNEIHASNMSKLDANENPILREDGKILKRENYFKPNINKILNE